MSEKHNALSSAILTLYFNNYISYIIFIFSSSIRLWKWLIYACYVNIAKYVLPVEFISHRKALKATALLFPLLGIPHLLFCINPKDNGSLEEAYMIVNAFIKSSQVSSLFRNCQFILIIFIRFIMLFVFKKYDKFRDADALYGYTDLSKKYLAVKMLLW